MKKIVFTLFVLLPCMVYSQSVMTPELLWSLGRVAVVAESPTGNQLIYRVSKTDIATEKSRSTYFLMDMRTKQTKPIQIFEGKMFVQWDEQGLYARSGNTLLRSTDLGLTWNSIYSDLKDAMDVRVSPDGRWIAYSMEVSMEKTAGNEIYHDATNSTAQIYTDLGYRHWDQWYTGKVNHVFLSAMDGSSTTDLLHGLPYNCPTKPFGGVEDFVFTRDSKALIYVTKTAEGKEAMQSTNTDLYYYDIEKKSARNITSSIKGYDLHPCVSPDNNWVLWSSMKHDGYESDKADLMIQNLRTGAMYNLTENWDETVSGDFRWSRDGKKIYFTAAYRGTQQLFAIQLPKAINERSTFQVNQITRGDFNLTTIGGEFQNELIISRTDFNHAAELYAVYISHGTMADVSKVNAEIYNQIGLSKSELKMIKTADGQTMGVWVIYPPNFDPSKKYPSLLYCQGGPQSALSQFYSLRWNFQLMAANGYIVIAPNRRGMPGWGVKWNEAISKDWGGMPMHDYLSAADAMAAEPYIDKDRMGCVGASYGGYSVYMLAGIHQGRFKSFIAHDGLFDMKSWYGTTEELWFANWDLGGNYWDLPVPKAYDTFNPSNFIQQWNTPILIIQGGLDFRVPIEQGLQAFQAAQLRGIKSKLLYFPDENHWILHPHNGLVWQREFFSWLKQTL